MPAKKRTSSSSRKRSRTSSGKRSLSSRKPGFFRRFFSFLFSPPVLIILLLVVIVIVVLTFWHQIIGAGSAAWKGILEFFGIGLAFILMVIVLAILFSWIKKGHLLTNYWNYWLGSISFLAAIWGILTFMDPACGGTVGQKLIGSSTAGGILRIIGLIILGIIFIAPRWLWGLVCGFFIVLGKAFKGIWDYSTRPKLKPLANAPKHEYESVMPAHEPEPEHVMPQTITQKPMPSTHHQETAPDVENDGQIIPAPDIKAAPALPLEPVLFQTEITVGGWQLPPMEVLDKPSESDIVKPDTDERAKDIIRALRSYGVEAEIADIKIGPTVTQYGITPGWDRKFKEIKEKDRDGNIIIRREEVSKTRVKVERINSLANDLALALASPSIRIEAPIPGKAMVGIEVPNATFSSVKLRSIIESAAFQKMRAKSKLTIALGTGAGGETLVADLAKMPHLLVAGATGSGKSVFLNSSICSLLMNNTPDDLQLIMIDPKRVELVTYGGLPHLIAPVVVDVEKAVSALKWLAMEMDERYRRFAQAGARNLEAYNKDRHPGETLPYIVLFIDELADLMMTAFDEVEHTLCRIAQLSRATGIHLVVATQRPSVDVVTGLIKANFPTRLSFALTSQVDSRTILDSAGAEKLLGRGDMLYLPTDAAKPKRLQGSFLSDAEMDRLVEFWRKQRRIERETVKFEEAAPFETGGKQEVDDPLMENARQLALDFDKVSASFLQRRLHIGYPRAARIYEQLQAEGLAGKEHEYEKDDDAYL